MEEVKRMDELTKIDERHLLLGQITGRVPDLQKRHDFVTAIEMHAAFPTRFAASSTWRRTWRCISTSSMPSHRKCSTRPTPSSSTR